MGIQRFRFDRAGKPDANGAIPLYSVLSGGQTLAGVRNCPCDDDFGVRVAYATGVPDTVFSVPAVIGVRGKRITGWIGCADGQWRFHRNADT